MNNTRIKLNPWILAAVLGVPTTLPALASDADDIAALKAQVQELDQKIRILERQHELEDQSTTQKEAALPKITVGQDGFTMTSGNTNYSLSLHGVLQMDTRTFEHNDHVSGSSGFLLRRARPIISGTVARDFDFMFVPDFGNAAPGRPAPPPPPRFTTPTSIIIIPRHCNWRPENSRPPLVWNNCSRM